MADDATEIQSGVRSPSASRFDGKPNPLFRESITEATEDPTPRPVQRQDSMVTAVNFNIPRPAPVADVGGDILIEFPGGGSKCLLQVPAHIPAGTTLNIRLKVVAPTAAQLEVAGFHGGQRENLETDGWNGDLREGHRGPALEKKEPEGFWESITGEQQLVLLSILAGIIGLGVGVAMISQNTDVWSNARAGSTMLLGVVFASLVACAESGFFTPSQLPMLEMGAALAANTGALVMLLPCALPQSLWLLGLCFAFVSTFHARHIFVMHRRLNNAAAARLTGESGQGKGSQGAKPEQWLPVRLLVLVAPFACMWAAVPTGLHYAASTDRDWVLAAAHGCYVLTALGTLAPTLCFLDKSKGGAVLGLYTKQEYVRLLWVALNGATLALLASLGGTRLQTPIALVLPAVAFFGLTAWPNLPEFRVEILENTAVTAAAASKNKKEVVKPRGLSLFSAVTPTTSTVVPRGIGTMALAVLCLGVCVASRYLAGPREPSAALAPFFALLLGSAAYYANGEDQGLQLPRITLAATFLVSSFWTGKYSSVVTQAFAASVWALLQLSEWRSVVATATHTLAHSAVLKIKAGSSASSLSSSSFSSQQQQQQQQQAQALQWHQKSLPPRIFFTGAVLTSASFAMTDWLDRFAVESENDDSSKGGEAGFFVGRALFSVTFLPLLAAAANVKRAQLDDSSEKGTCCLIALTLPLIAAFASSGPWYDNTAVLGFFFSLVALAAMRAINDGTLWLSRGIALDRTHSDRAVYVLFLVLFTSTLAHDFFPHQNWVVTLLSFLSAGVAGVATSDAASRLAMARPPIVGALMLFIFSSLAQGSEDDGKGGGGSFNAAERACIPLLLVIPLAFIAVGLSGRLGAGVSIDDLRVDLALACVWFSLCASPFTAVVVGMDVEYKYQDDDEKTSVTSSQLPDSAWALLAVVVLALALFAATVLFKVHQALLLLTNGGDKTAALSILVENGGGGVDGGGGDGSTTTTTTATGGGGRFGHLFSSSSGANGKVDVRDVMVAGGVVLVGSMSCEMPAALLLSTAVALFWAHKRDSLHSAVLATFMFLSRALMQTFYGLYAWPANIWLLIYGVLLIFIVMLWPQVLLIAPNTTTSADSDTANKADGNLGAVANVLSFAFTAAGVMMLGPATQGWGSLAGTAARTASLVYQDSQFGALRAAVGTPVLYFGSLCFILQRFEPDHFVSIAALLTAGVALLGASALTLRKSSSSSGSGSVGESGGESGADTDTAVAHFLVFLVAFPLGLASSASTGGWGPLGIALLVGGWAYAHVKQHALCAVALVFAIPVILMSSVASLVHPELGRSEQRGYLGLTVFLWGLKLILVGKCVLGTSPSSSSSSTAASSSSPKSSSSSSGSFTFSSAMVGAVRYLNELGVGSSGLFVPSGLLWLLASLVFVDGWAALAFALALVAFVTVELVQSKRPWYWLVGAASLSVVVCAAVVDVGTGIVWNGAGSSALVSALTLPLPWVIKVVSASSSSGVSGVNVDDGETRSSAWQVASFVACVLTIPFGFSASVATRGTFAPLSVAAVLAWSVAHPSLHALGAATLPNLALVSGCLLRHGGSGQELLGKSWGDALPGLVLAVSGLVLAGAGSYFQNDEAALSRHKAQGEVALPNAHWVPEGFLGRCGAVAVLLGLASLAAGLVGVAASAALIFFVGASMFLEEEEKEGAEEEGGTAAAAEKVGGGDTPATTSATSAAAAAAGAENGAGPSKGKVVEMCTFLLLVITCVCVAGWDLNFTGFAADVSSAVVVVSASGFVLACACFALDPARKLVPIQVVDFLVYLWFVAGGLVGAAATHGSLGIVSLFVGAAWSLHRHHALLCCLAFPCLMFWAGAELNQATDRDRPCVAIGLPVLCYGLLELVAAAALRSEGKFMGIREIPLKGVGSAPSWANPSELVPNLFSSALEVSGVVFAVAGALGVLYCPGDGKGDLGLGGELAFCFLLGLVGIYILRRGLVLRSKHEATAGDVAIDEVATQQQEQGQAAISTQASATSLQRDAKLLGFRYRLAGLLSVNGAVWLVLPVTEDLAVRSTVIVLGSLTLLGSACMSMYWKRDLDLLGVVANTVTAPPPRAPSASHPTTVGDHNQGL